MPATATHLDLWINPDSDSDPTKVNILFSQGDSRLIMLTERVDHRIVQTAKGVSCSCRKGRNGKPCRHVKALREVGLIR